MAVNIQMELARIELGDERRRRRAAKLAGRMAAAPQKSVRAACKGWNEAIAAFRLLHNRTVTPAKILAAHERSTLQRASQCKSLLVIDDTTELDYTSHKALEGTGPLSTLSRRGFFAHSHLLVAEQEGVALGLCGSRIWARDDAEHGKAKNKKETPFEKKESYRWLEGYLKACTVVENNPQAEVVFTGDRECDIYEIFAEWQRRKEKALPCAEIVVRSGRDRALTDGGHLHEKVRQGKVLGSYEIEFSSKMQARKVKGNRHLTHRKGRKAELEVRSARVRLRPPWRKQGEPLPVVELGVIGVFELDPPEGQEPIEWILLTSLPVETFDQAKRGVDIYTQRWLIEEFHRILKSGCRVEQIAFRDSDSLLAAVALYMVIAWRILYLRDYGRAAPRLCCSMFFTEAEWKAAFIVFRKATGPDPPTLAEMLAMVGKIGGHMGRKTDPPPGPECLWRGLQELRCYVTMGEAAGVL